MATVAEAYSAWAWNGIAGNYRLYSRLERVGNYDVANNRSLVWVRTWLQSTAPAYFYDIDTSQELWFDGALMQRYGTRRSITAGGSTLVMEGQYWLNHNAVGDRTIAAGTLFSSSYTGTHTVDVSLVLDRIPRATEPTWSGNFTAGVEKTITLPRASTAFTHEVRYLWGTSNVLVATAATTEYKWTPPLSLIDAIPDSTTGFGTIRIVTKNGSTVIGTKDKRFDLDVPADIIPTVSQVLWDDSNPTTKTVVGAFVQGVSLIKGAVTAAGIHNSTIKSRSLKAGGQEFTEADAWQPTASGTIVAEGRATDSRGRVGIKSANFDVLPYTPPTIEATTRVRRAIDDTGTLGDGPYLRLDITAAVQSLIVSSTQKNELTLTVRTRAVGDTGPWATRNDVTPTGVLSYTNQYIQIGGGDQFATNTSYDIEVTVADKLGNKATSRYRIGTISAALDLVGNAAGIGKIWERGTLDVGGDTYATNFRADEGMYVGAGAASSAYGIASITTPYGLMGGSFSGTTAQRLALATAGKAVDGIIFHDTDEDRTYQRRGGGWAWIFPEVSTSSSTTQTVTSQVALTGMSQTVVLSTTQSLKFNIRFRGYGVAGALVELTLWDGSTKIASWTKPANSGGGGTPNEHSVEIIRSIAAGSHTFSVRAQCVIGTSVTSFPDASLSPNQLSISPL